MTVETTVLTGLEQRAFWAHFEALTRIPRPSRAERVVDHSFQLPLQICWIVTAIVGMVVVWLFFGGHTPAPPTPTTTGP